MMRKLLVLLALCLIVAGVNAAFDSNTVLYIPANGTEASTSFVDLAKGATITVVSDANINTTTKKFGSGSLKSITNGDYLTVPDSTNWDFGTGNFTVATWVYPIAAPTGYIPLVQQYVDDSNYWTLFSSYGDGIPQFDVYISTTRLGRVKSSTTIPTNQWSYVVVTRNGTGTNPLHIYINGTDRSTGSTNLGSTSMPTLAGSLYISGQASGVNANQYLDDVVIVKGVAFNGTVPTSEYVGEAPGSPPIASFTCTPTSTTLGTPVTCTDASTNSPTNWTYYWGDGNVTDGTQNPSYTYPFTGTFSINQTVNNTIGSSWYNRSNYIQITNVTSFHQQDIYLTGQYTITFNVKSSTTNLPIANVTVVDAVSGQSYPSTNGTAFLTEPAGLIYVNFIADGYQTKQVTYVVDQDETHEVKLVPSSPAVPSPPSIVYIPQQVRFQLIGTDGAYLSNVFIQATPINFTAPANWTETLLGISPSVGIRDTTVYGTTASDGSWVAPMLQSFQYQINLTRGTDVNYNFTIYPLSNDYKFTIPVAGWLPIVTPSNIVSYSLQNATINESSTVMYQFINMTYSDGSLNTDKLSFVVYNANNTLVYSQNYTGAAANAQNFSYVQQCNKGQAYTYGFQANQSAYGWINQSSTIKLISQVELLANGPAWITQWFAIAMIVIFGTLFMIFSKAYGLVGIPLLTWSFQYVFGFLPATFLSNVALLCMLTIGVLVYIRQAENKIQ